MNTRFNTPFMGRLLTLILAMSVLLSGCMADGSRYRAIMEKWFSDSREKSELSVPQYDAADGLVSFSKMEYERPDADAITQRLSDIGFKMRTCDSFKELKPLIEEMESLYDWYYTMLNLAQIYHKTDMSDTFWAEECVYLAENEPSLTSEYDSCYVFLYDSVYREQVMENFGDAYFDHIWDEDVYYTDKVVELLAEEARLYEEYSELLATASVQFGDRSYTYYDIYAVEDMDTYSDLLWRWYAAYYNRLAKFYISLVQVRQQIAEESGFDHYTEYLFRKEKDYTPQSFEALLDEIAEKLGPLYLEAWRYEPDETISFDACSAFLQNAFGEMNPALRSGFEQMLACGLIGYEPGSYKYGGASTYELYSYHTPYILMSYTEDFYSIGTLVHEFGHAYAAMQTDDLYETTDMSEVYSQTLELLLSNYYDSLYSDESAEAAKRAAVLNVFDTIVYQAYFAAVEFAVYEANPDTLTPQRLGEIAGEQAYRFGLTDIADDEYYQKDWIGTTHLFESPFYVTGYVSSACVALQVWQLSLTDEAKAVRIYDRMIQRTESSNFVENVTASGLESPFESGIIRRIKPVFVSYLEKAAA